jgi:Putative GTPase activating protein for Arf
MSINLGVFLCGTCADMHREELPSFISTIRLLGELRQLDATAELLLLMEAAGNARANMFWESKVLGSSATMALFAKPRPDTEHEFKRAWIKSKYETQHFAARMATLFKTRLGKGKKFQRRFGTLNGKMRSLDFCKREVDDGNVDVHVPLFGCHLHIAVSGASESSLTDIGVVSSTLALSSSSNSSSIASSSRRKGRRIALHKSNKSSSNDASSSMILLPIAGNSNAGGGGSVIGSGSGGDVPFAIELTIAHGSGQPMLIAPVGTFSNTVLWKYALLRAARSPPSVRELLRQPVPGAIGSALSPRSSFRSVAGDTAATGDGSAQQQAIAQSAPSLNVANVGVVAASKERNALSADSVQSIGANAPSSSSLSRHHDKSNNNNSNNNNGAANAAPVCGVESPRDAADEAAHRQLIEDLASSSFFCMPLPCAKPLSADFGGFLRRLMGATVGNADHEARLIEHLRSEMLLAIDLQGGAYKFLVAKRAIEAYVKRLAGVVQLVRDTRHHYFSHDSDDASSSPPPSSSTSPSAPLSASLAAAFLDDADAPSKKLLRHKAVVFCWHSAIAPSRRHRTHAIELDLTMSLVAYAIVHVNHASVAVTSGKVAKAIRLLCSAAGVFQHIAESGAVELGAALDAMAKFDADSSLLDAEPRAKIGPTLSSSALHNDESLSPPLSPRDGAPSAEASGSSSPAASSRRPAAVSRQRSLKFLSLVGGAAASQADAQQLLDDCQAQVPEATVCGARALTMLTLAEARRLSLDQRQQELKRRGVEPHHSLVACEWLSIFHDISDATKMLHDLGG